MQYVRSWMFDMHTVHTWWHVPAYDCWLIEINAAFDSNLTELCWKEDFCHHCLFPAAYDLHFCKAAWKIAPKWDNWDKENLSNERKLEAPPTQNRLSLWYKYPVTVLEMCVCVCVCVSVENIYVVSFWSVALTCKHTSVPYQATRQWPPEETDWIVPPSHFQPLQASI